MEIIYYIRLLLNSYYIQQWAKNEIIAQLVLPMVKSAFLKKNFPLVPNTLEKNSKDVDFKPSLNYTKLLGIFTKFWNTLYIA